MGFMDGLKMRKAMLKHQNGDLAGAKEGYEDLYGRGIVNAAYMMHYSVLLLREGGEENYLKVKEILKKAEKAKDMTDERRIQLWMNYAVAEYKLGDLDKAIRMLETSHKRGVNGLTYGSLGFLYIESGDAEKALAYNLEAYEYDDEDPVVLDNLGQTYYRLLNDKEKAKEYFDKAIALKENQIDTLYFLAQYDMEAGKKEEAREKLEKALAGRFSPLNYATKARVEEALESLKNE